MKPILDLPLKIFSKIYGFAQTLRKTTVLIYCLLITIALGVMDYYTTPDFTFTIFYLIPVSIAAWFSGRNTGLAVSLFCAFTGYVVHLLWPKILVDPLVPYWDALTELTFFVITALILSKLKIIINMERNIARTDYLTKISNSRYFYELTDMQMKIAHRLNSFISIAYLDLDNFKEVNDTFGHLAGDAVLKIVAETLKNAVREIDITARLGGDEFVIFMPNTNFQEAEKVLDRIKSALANILKSNNWNVTVSVGAVTCPGQSCMIDSLIKSADSLMFEAKANGKNRSVHKNVNEIPSTHLRSKL
jgi:diguanylate cyclase (GGDEF)-like protein